jgi:hypothetical protein
MSIWLDVFCGMSDEADAKREQRDEQELDRWGISPASVKSEPKPDPAA